MNNDKNPLDPILKAMNFMNMNRNTAYNEAITNDKRLESIVIYKLTNGHTDMPKFVKTMPVNSKIEDIEKVYKKELEFSQEISKLFKEFKMLIKRGSFTLDELEDRIFTEYGIVSKNTEDRVNMLFDVDVEFAEESEESEE